MSDTVVVMNNGRIEQSGTPEELYNSPGTEFVARFIGEMNFFDARVIAGQGDMVELDWKGEALRARRADAAASPGRAVSAAVRPEYLAVTAHRPEGRVNAIRGRVHERVFRGTELRYVVAVEGMHVDVSTRDPEAMSLPEEVWVSWDPDKMFLIEPSRTGADRAATQSQREFA